MPQSVKEALSAWDPSQPQYWNALWRSTQEASRASGRGIECWQNWDDLADARQYWQRVSASEQKNERAHELLAEVQSHWRVLDIGAGPGNLALPLAGKAAHVTAVEPASGMAQVLRENIAQAGLSNVSVVQKRWDDVDVAQDLQGPYELVVISFAFGMLDLLDTLRKILAVASQRVIFYWHAGPQAWDVDAVKLWPLLHGKTFTPIPKAEVIFNLLYTLGIYADVKSMPRSFTTAFESLDEAMQEYGKRYAVAEDDAPRRQLLLQYLQAHLVQEDGRYLQRAYNTGMRIAWNVPAVNPLQTP
ncbi:MAG: class I SAM-dependent methyltransferase [Brachymonas sp.]|nr:class I SAM-dependent methyltransferase [Brachymonas sp.]